MSGVLGIDTSNYTTSAAIYDVNKKEIQQKKKLLPVKSGELGLRQSDAAFLHTRQLPDVIDDLFNQYNGTIKAIAASDRPSQIEDSYMPCFLSGAGAARQIAAILHLPLQNYSHQQGHVAAAAFGAGNISLLSEELIAFHVSGGTTDVLYVKPDKLSVISCCRVAGSLDLKAGQLIDRVGVMLGLSFPAGPALEKLALASQIKYTPKPVIRDGWCCLSGVENQCRNMKEHGAAKEEIAMFCLANILSALKAMSAAVLKRYPNRPLLFAGGVMSNRILQAEIRNSFGGYFAPPAFSADNAAGIALLASMQTEGMC